MELRPDGLKKKPPIIVERCLIDYGPLFWSSAYVVTGKEKL